ncbi:glutamine amidotransferase [Tropicimonas isoalkanivorans]|uniref:GMP synthase (Glutamine-hydrolysing) n=1 Tax=Tropicimonas isoalkanivorans TaxID=441112 RepID=A0A1I1NUG8_9RHOB|nr:glutamine amidotransferase [Tropicimonas isoalkanivorans]SFC98383.1 GMP synthase (glutamine-hydrolysing) [Tropicimonas isoalkanivorans]
MKPFLILQLRPEPEASDNEYEAFLSRGGLRPEETRRIRLEREEVPGDLDLTAFSGIIVGGGPGCVSDPDDTKPVIEKAIEREILGMMPQITEQDIPFLGCCYGIGILAHHLGAEVSKARYGEPVGAVSCEVTPDGRNDPVLAGLPERFDALVGHKEAVQTLPPGCVHLLASDPCPFQMIRYGRNVYATQFHPEADGAVFALRIAIYKDKGYFPPEEADALTETVLASKVDLAPRLLRNFVQTYRQSRG